MQKQINWDNIQVQSVHLLHMVSPEDKLKPEWAYAMMNHHYYFGNMDSLLAGKNVNEIDCYAEGRQPMGEFKKAYIKGEKRAVNHDQNPDDAAKYVETVVGTEEEDLEGIDFEPLALLVQPINAAIATISKQPVEAVATAVDALANKKRKQDRELLQNKDRIEEQLAPIAAKMGVSKIDIGGTEHNATGVTALPFGLEADDDNQLDIFFDMFYKLRPESAVEVLLGYFSDVKHLPEHQDMETRDQLYYGVSVSRPFLNETTGMPDLDQYTHPKDVYVNRKSKMPDCSDSDAIYSCTKYTITQFYEMFGDEIKSLEDLYNIIKSHTKAQGTDSTLAAFNTAEYWNTEIECIYMEWKSIDQLNIRTYVNSSGKLHRQIDKINVTSNNHTASFAENTYSAYWLPGTDTVFHIERDASRKREKGQEAFSSFSFKVHRTHKKSPVELCIGYVKMAQRAYIKMQHCINKSKPPGSYMNLSFIRQAAQNLSDIPGYSIKKLLKLYFVDNTMIGDTDGLDTNEMNQLPFIHIPGGVGKEVEGYAMVIDRAVQAISRMTGVNDQITGQAATPEGLVGTQKLLINASMNSIHYLTICKKRQATKIANDWCWWITSAIKQKVPGVYDTYKEIVGEKKVDLIGSLPEVAMHQIGIMIEVRSTEEEKLRTNEIVNNAVKAGVLTGAEALLLERIANIKDQASVLMLIEKKKMKNMQEAKEREYQAMQQAAAAQMQGEAQLKQIDQQGRLQEIQIQGAVDEKLMMAAAQIGLNKEYVQQMLKKDLQDRRGTSQLQKSLATIQAQGELAAKGLK